MTVTAYLLFYMSDISLATDCLASLVERDCDVILPDNSGCLAIHYAASNNRLDCVRFLIVQGTDLDVRQSQGKTPVHMVCISYLIFCKLPYLQLSP